MSLDVRQVKTACQKAQLVSLPSGAAPVNISVFVMIFIPVGQLAVGVHVESSLVHVISRRVIVTCDLNLISIAVVRETTTNFFRVCPHNLKHKKIET